MDRDHASLSFLASLLEPAAPDERTVLVTADADWRFRPGDLARDADAVAWGRRTASAADGSNDPSVLRAIRREIALHTIGRRLPEGFRVAALHRLPPPSARLASTRARVRRALLEGALVSLRRSVGPTVLDEVALQARVRVPPGRIVPGAGVGAWVRTARRDGSAVLLRLGPAGADGDPRRTAEGLKALEDAEVPLVPRPLGHGLVLRVAWSAETVLEGSPPRELSRSLAAEVAASLSRLPRVEGPPTSVGADLAKVRAAFPRLAGSLDEVAERAEGALEGLPGVLRHGDLWAGNLLVRGGSLAGVVDWDVWHPSGAPGADLLHLVVADAALRSGRPRGEVWRDRPWREPLFAAVAPAYWSALGLTPDERMLEGVALAGWAAQVAANLRHTPELASRRAWVVRNIEPVLGGG
jgi:hypothetical protein